jgi:hypothetical protein
MVPAQITVITTKDNMSKIQSKLNNKGIVQFTPGIYKITKQLIIPSDTIVDLNSATLQRKGNLQSVFLNKVTSKTTKYTGAGNITIKNGTLEGMGGYSYDNLLTFFHSHDVIIENITFKDTLCHALEINSSEGVHVHNCNFLGYNLKDIESAYKEMIQIDHAGYSGFVLSGSTKKSKCYDGTCCENIRISNCLFSKSNYRDYPYACIGEHSQLSGNHKHKNIMIHNNAFNCKLNAELVQACLSFTAMENVDICNNSFVCNRVARIYSKNYSYLPSGEKVEAKSGDGICNGIHFRDNTIHECTSKTAFQIYNKSGKANHKDIVKVGNNYE